MSPDSDKTASDKPEAIHYRTKCLWNIEGESKQCVASSSTKRGANAYH